MTIDIRSLALLLRCYQWHPQLQELIMLSAFQLLGPFWETCRLHGITERREVPCELPAKILLFAVEICKYHPPGGPEQIVAVKRMNGNAAVDVEVFASEANILRKLKHK